MQYIKNQEVTFRYRANVMGQSGVNEVDEERRGKQDDIIIVNGGWG